MTNTIELWAKCHFFNVSRVLEFIKRPEIDKFIIIDQHGKVFVSNWWSNELAKAYEESVPSDVLATERQESFKSQRAAWGWE